MGNTTSDVSNLPLTLENIKKVEVPKVAAVKITPEPIKIVFDSSSKKHSPTIVVDGCPRQRRMMFLVFIVVMVLIGGAAVVRILRGPILKVSEKF